MRHTARFVWLLSFVFSTPALAATITVTSTTDELQSNGNCSLREAIEAANGDSAVDACAAGSGADVIVLPAGTYTLTLTGAGEDANATGDLDVTGELKIQGDGAATTIIDGNGSDRVLQASAALTLTQLTVRNGRLPASTSTGTTSWGGGIACSASLTLDDVTVTGNVAGAAGGSDWQGGFGGGIVSQGVLTIGNSRFFGNSAGAGTSPTSVGGSGGAIAHTSGNVVTISGSTFSANDADSGGALYDSGTSVVQDSTFSGNGGSAIAFEHSLAITGCTFTGNDGIIDGYQGALGMTIESSTFFGNRGGGIRLSHSNAVGFIYGSTIAYNDNGLGVSNGAAIKVRNSIVIGNSALGDCAAGVGTIGSDGYNVFGAAGGCIGDQPGDQAVTAAIAMTTVSQTLVSLGGPTEVLPLPAGSVAIGSGTCTDAQGQPVATDQVGQARVTPCSVGAVQASPAAATLVDVTPEPAGAHCATGGQRVDAGVDSNGDGMLEPGEITATTYICDSAGGDGGTASGGATLVSVTPLASGDAHCAHGGSRVDAGADSDGDGMLESREITTTRWLCSEPAASGGCQMTGMTKGGPASAAPLWLLLLGLAAARRRRRQPS